MYSLSKTLALFAAAAAMTAAAVPSARSAAFRIGALDIPDGKRKLHSSVTPRAGGMAIFAIYLILIFIFCKIGHELAYIISGSFLLFALGLADDVLDLSAVLKFCVQTVCALTAVAEGIRLTSVPGIISVLFIVAVTNAHNLTDGIDGLAIGISAVESIAVAAICIFNGNSASATAALIICGCCVGILPYNSCPAGIFIGDSGAYLLGYTLSALAVSAPVPAEHTAAILFLLFAYPLTDTLYSLFRRLTFRTNPFVPDRHHLHHVLSDKIGVRLTVFILTSFQALCCAAACFTVFK